MSTGPTQDTAGASRLRRLKALMLKESKQVVRDPSSILIAFVLPLILLFLFGYGISLDAEDVDLGVVMEDQSPMSQSLAESFVGSRYFNARIGRDRREFTPDIVAGRLRGMVVIPQDFTETLQSPGRRSAIQVIADGSRTNTASYVHNYTQGVLATWLRQMGLVHDRAVNPPVELVSRVWFNPALESRYSLVPGSLAMIMAIIGTLLTALVVAREWERGTMEALLSTPVNTLEIIVGKLTPYFVLGMLSMVGCVLITVLVFGVPYRGSVAGLLVTAAAFMLAALGQGLFISTVSKNQFIASQAALLSGFLPAFLLSGFIFEIAAMPLPVRVVTYIIPARYLVTNLQTLFLAGDVWPLMLVNVGALVCISFVFYALTARTTSSTLE